MLKGELREHKRAPKRLDEWPAFKPAKRKKHPKPFDRIGGGRISCTGLIDVSDTHSVFFVAKDGEAFTDSAFYGYLMCRLSSGDLSPIFEFHWHPSHKGAHIKVPCRTFSDYTNRFLPGAPELNISMGGPHDPRTDRGRKALMAEFCQNCGVDYGPPEPSQSTLWK